MPNQLVRKQLHELRDGDIRHVVKVSALDDSWTVVGTLSRYDKTLGYEIPWGSYLSPETPVRDVYGYVVLWVGPFTTPQLQPNHPILVEHWVPELEPVSRETPALVALPLALETLAVANNRRLREGWDW